MMEFFPGKHAKKLRLLRNQSGLLCQFTRSIVMTDKPFWESTYADKEVSTFSKDPTVDVKEYSAVFPRRPLLQKNLPLCILHNHAGSHHNKRFVPNILP